jgi:hypothetical protein
MVISAEYRVGGDPCDRAYRPSQNAVRVRFVSSVIGILLGGIETRV